MTDIPSDEIVAWSYELATYRHPTCGTYSGWRPCLTTYKPCVPDGSIRNLVPLAALRAEHGIDRPQGPSQTKPSGELYSYKGFWDSNPQFERNTAAERVIEAARKLLNDRGTLKVVMAKGDVSALCEALSQLDRAKDTGTMTDRIAPSPLRTGGKS